MTTGTLFNQLKAGKITKEQFLYEVRRDQNLPFISPLTTFKEAIQILQNRGIITEVFEMGSLEEACPCGGSYESHEDAGEMVCAACGERKPLGEDNDMLTKGLHRADKLPSSVVDEDNDTLTKGAYRADKLGSDVLGEDPDEEEYDPFYDREEEINYGVEDDEKGDDMVGNREEDFVSETPSLREQVQDFIKKAVKGGSSMDEAKQQAREYFAKTPAALNEDASQAAAVSKAVGEKVKFDDYDANDRPIFTGKNPDIEYTVDKKGNIYKHDGFNTKKVGTLNEGVKLTVDQVNPYEFKKGVNIEMGVDKSAAPDWSSYLGNLAGDIEKAQAKVLKNLAKDPAYYTNMIANKKIEKVVKVNSDGYTKGKMTEKANVTNKKQRATKVAGVKTMPDKGVTGTEKVIKEDKVSKIREYVKAQLKKETQLVKSATTGATIDVVPDSQAQQMKADLQKKGVKTVSTKV